MTVVTLHQTGPEQQHMHSNAELERSEQLQHAYIRGWFGARGFFSSVEQEQAAHTLLETAPAWRCPGWRAPVDNVGTRCDVCGKTPAEHELTPDTPVPLRLAIELLRPNHAPRCLCGGCMQHRQIMDLLEKVKP